MPNPIALGISLLLGLLCFGGFVVGVPEPKDSSTSKNYSPEMGFKKPIPRSSARTLCNAQQPNWRARLLDHMLPSLGKYEVSRFWMLLISTIYTIGALILESNIFVGIIGCT
ncbi:hypothetical protein BX070DRAFT_56006 [Coemansia spiralis]|nr:hypothetical protein BX070DRAFT_56006 [Coemansia spiralis]